MQYLIGYICGVSSTLLAVYMGAYLYFKAGKNEFPIVTLPKSKNKARRAKRDDELDE